MGSGATYHGGLAWAPNPGWGELTLNDEVVELVGRGNKLIVKVGVSVIESVEVMSEQVAKSRIGAVLVFGVLGLGAKASRDRGTLLIHLKNGQTGFFTIADYSEHQLLAKLAPWIH